MRIWNQKNCKVLLLVDNCLAHKVAFLYCHIKVVSLPQSIIGVIQPLDLGIIRSFKCKFLKKLIRHLKYRIYNLSISIFDAYKNNSIKDAILFFYLAWNEVEPKTII